MKRRGAIKVIFFQQVYLLVLRPCLRITEKLSQGGKDVVTRICVFLIILLAFYGEAKDLMKQESILALCIMQSFLLGIIILMSIHKPLQRIKWKILLPVCWLLLSIIIILTSLHHFTGPGFQPMGIMMLTVFPCLFFVWNNRGDYKTLYDMVAKSVVIVSLLFFAICVLYNPYTSDTIRYLGFTGNPGSLGKICVAALICGLYLMITAKKTFWLYAIFLGAWICMSFLSLARIAIVVLIVESIFFIYLYVKKQAGYHVKKTRIFSRMLIIFVLIAITYPATVFLLTNGYSFVNSDYQQEQSQSVQQSEEEEEPVSADDESLNSDSVLESRISIKGKNLDTFSSGRIAIYEASIKNLNLVGNDMNKPVVVLGTVHVFHSHNTVLEFAYRNGIPAGIMFFIIEFITMIYLFRTVFKREVCEEYEYFMIFAITGFGLSSLTDLVYNPAANPSVFFYFLALMPLFRKESRKRGNIKYK